MSYTWKARVAVDNKYIQDVTVEADSVMVAQALIERQYGRIISGPQQVWSPPAASGNTSDGYQTLLAVILAVIIYVVGSKLGISQAWAFGSAIVGFFVVAILAGILEARRR